MYLKEIKINGFKSFADKINIELGKGITGVVGPNGSGKSNIVDAVRWVLGEQSVKSLRGDGTMSDVIFSGSKSRNPMSNASVTLVFDNSDHSLKLDYDLVSIKRTIYRSGENEYFINNERTRLKDILELLMDSGSGKESFSIISQGDIANILSNKPVDRRVIFESAAGVLKYKKRKEEAVKKLEKTHDNIDRIDDIISELEKQVTPLKEQSEKAIIYKNTKKELEDIEISLIVHDLDTLSEEKTNSKLRIEELNKEIISLSTDNSKCDAEVSSKKLELSNLNDKLHKNQNLLLEITKEVEKLNGEKNIISERKKYESEDIKLHSNITLLKEEEAKYTSSKFLLNDEIDSIRNILSEKAKESSNLENILSNLEIDKNKLYSSYNSKMKVVNDNEYRIDVLNRTLNNNDNYSYAIKSVLNNTRLSGICDTIGNIIKAKDGYENAIDTAIGYSTSYVVCEDEMSAKNAIEYLKFNKLGRVTFFPLNIIEGKYIDSSIYSKVEKCNGFINIASNLVSYNDKYKNIILNCLGNIIVVDNIDNANSMARLINYRYRIVTLDGEIIHVGGSLTGGMQKKSTSIILDKMELDKLVMENNKLKSYLSDIQNDINNNKDVIDRNTIKLDTIKRSIIYNTEILNVKSKELDELNEKLDSVKDNISSISNIIDGSFSSEEESIINKYYASVGKKELVVSEISKLNESIKLLSDEINILEHDYKASNSEYNKKSNELKELEIKVGKIDVKLDNLLNILTEYNLTYEKAKKNYILVMESDIARSKVSEYKKIIDDLGIVNLGAIEEYERVKTRYEFLNNQKNDLFKAENTLLEIIKEMDSVMEEDFNETFKLIKDEFKLVFRDLFNGGDADLRLTNPDNILETGIDIVALPPGKKLTSISLLSGGEKALTAIALLFAILKVKPVPFCILDEVEAPLDEANVDIFGKFVSKMSENTQFIIITHKKKTMEYANVLYGVTMQESGVSKLVSVRLEEL